MNAFPVKTAKKLAVMATILVGPAWAELPHAVRQMEQERIAAIEKAKVSAVSVFARGGRGGGSGVVISPDGYALTNFHVVKPAGSYMQCSMADGKLYDAVIVGIDPTGDVGLIKLLGREDFPTAEMADSDEVRAGDWCFAVGNPFLLATDFQPTVTWGIVSGVHRYQYPAGTLLEYADCIQTDAAINPGNSGGPLYNARGQLIGVNGRGSFEKRGRVNVGVGYAISINQIKNFMGYLRSGRIVDHATLGATVATDEEDSRVVVTNILDSADVYRRGLRYGDEIVSFGGRSISTVNGFKNALGIFPRGWRIPLSFRSEGDRYDVSVRLAGVHSREELMKKVQAGPKMPRSIPRPKDKEEQPGKTPQPKDGKPEDGEDNKPNGKEDGRPKPHPRPIPVDHVMPAAKPMPKHVKKLFKARDGYANYYFNELNRSRVWDGFVGQTDFTDLSGQWIIHAEFADGGPIDLVLGGTEVKGTFEGTDQTIDLSTDLSEQRQPIGSGGLLVALHLWQRLLIAGPEKFGEVYYLGTAPMLGRSDLVDVLVGTHDVVESRFFFDPQTGRLVGMEMFADMDDDPCEVFFEDYREVNGYLLPHRVKVLFGDEVFGVIDFREFELPPAAEEEA